jgi:LemA protein
MSKGLGCLAIVVVAVIVLALAAMGTYNNLVGLSQATDSQWAQVESSYQRRADLIPNLVATVQGAANFEKSTLEAVTAARASVGQAQAGPGITNDPQAFAKWQASQDQLSGALSRLLVVVERYPDLKANANFRDLQAQLEGTENRINVERGRYNEVAAQYNTARLRFPAAVVAPLMGFKEKAYFRSAAGAERAPNVNFDFGRSPAPGSAPGAPGPGAPTAAPSVRP